MCFFGEGFGMSNPYSLVFGVEPEEYITRISQTENIVSSLSDGSQRIYMVTGVRGSGKTVFMNEIKKTFASKEEWVAIELSTERDMLAGLINKLGNEEGLRKFFKGAKINLSLMGFGVEINRDLPSFDAEIEVGKMLKVLKKHKKRVLVLADEIADNKAVREFASVFQILIRDEMPINLLMTGLYENIDDLQNEKNLTFLHRAPKIHLSPLSIGTMAASYRKNLKVDYDLSIQLAQLTRGYSYAFQVLGYCLFENGVNYDDAVVKLKQYLEEYVYDKIWSELSEKDKKIVHAISKASSGKIQEIRGMLSMESNEFTPYKKRLLRKGIIGDESGYARLTLPLFDEFVRENYYT